METTAAALSPLAGQKKQVNKLIFREIPQIANGDIAIHLDSISLSRLFYSPLRLKHTPNRSNSLAARAPPRGLYLAGLQRLYATLSTYVRMFVGLASFLGWAGGRNNTSWVTFSSRRQQPVDCRRAGRPPGCSAAAAKVGAPRAAPARARTL